MGVENCKPGTGFHPADPDWTRGRAKAIADANAQARKEAGLARRVTLKGGEV